MARILIVEPSTEVRELLALVVARSGHEPVFADAKNGELSDVEMIVAEPADPSALPLVRRLREERAGLPVICVSIYGWNPEIAAFEPSAYLEKPFGLAELERAIDGVLALS